MNFTLATIAVLLLLLPGVRFIVGVNFADKNVREIVFRNTPAEVGYVLVISLAVHLLFALIFPGFNAANLIARYAAGAIQAQPEKARHVFIGALVYFGATAAAGFAPGVLLGLSVRRLRWWVLVKHRWMLDLVGKRKGDIVYARIFVTPHFRSGDDKESYAVIIDGILSDSFFAADGTLLYLVFSRYKEFTAQLSKPPFIEKFEPAWADPISQTGDRLVIEGKWVVMAHYNRVSGKSIQRSGALQKLRDRVTLDRRRKSAAANS